VGEVIPFPPPLPLSVVPKCRNCKASAIIVAANGLKVCSSCGVLQSRSFMKAFNNWLNKFPTVDRPYHTINEFIRKNYREGEDVNETT